MTEEQLVAMLKEASEAAQGYSIAARLAEEDRMRNRNERSTERDHFEMMAGIARFSTMLIDAALKATRKE